MTSKAADRSHPHGHLRKKHYEQELRRLHKELIKLQEWVRVKGLRLTPGRVKLPARQKGRRYKRPPENEQHFVPQKF